MSKKKVLELAKKMWTGKMSVDTEGWSMNGWGKWTAALYIDDEEFLKSSEEGTKRLATAALLNLVEEIQTSRENS